MLKLAMAMLIALSSPALAYDLSASDFVEHIIHDSIDNVPGTGMTYPFGHRVAPIDNNGSPDIVQCDVWIDTRALSPMGNGEVSTCYLWKNNGAGVFTKEFVTAGPGFFEHLASADVDNDGWQELFIPDNLNGGTFIFPRNGNERPWGRLLMAWNSTDMPRPYDIDAGFIDNDACEDVVIGGYTGGLVQVFRNPCPISGGTASVGNLGIWPAYTIASGMVTVRTTKLFQYDSDGRLDVLVSSSGNWTTGANAVPLSDTNPANHGAYVRILQNAGGINGHTVINIDTNARGAMQGDACDVDLDGDLDIVMPFGGVVGIIPESMHRIDWYEAPSWTRRTIANIPYAFDVACRNLDSDGYPEIVYTAHDSGSGSDNKGDRLGILEWRGSSWADIVLKSEWTGANDVTLADMDGDGKRDLVATADEGNGTPRTGGRQLIWFENVSP